MTTSEFLDITTPHGKVGHCYSVYRGPCQNRLTLREAFSNRLLEFSVNRSHIGAALGSRLVIGYYDNFAEAQAVCADAGSPFRISAHCKGCGYADECILPVGLWTVDGKVR